MSAATVSHSNRRVRHAQIALCNREAIDLGLSRGRNARAIWQDLVSEYGFASSYQRVQRFVRNRRGQTPEARVVIVTRSGQEAHALGQRGNAPLMGSGDARATLRTSGDFGQVDRLEPISTAKPP